MMTVLVATDLSKPSVGALRLGANLGRALDEPLHVVAVVEYWDRDMSAVMGAFELEHVEPSEQARDQLQDFVSQALGDAPRPQIERTVVLGHPPADEILSVVEELRPHFVVAGATGRNLMERALVGSTANALVRRSPVPVVLVPAEASTDAPRKILAPVDLSSASRHSAHLAVSLARQLEATLYLEYVVPVPLTSPVFAPVPVTPQVAAEMKARQKPKFEAFLSEFDLSGIACETLMQTGEPAHKIVKTAREREADLIVMGTHGRSALSRLVLGSTTERVLRDATVSVMTVRTPPNE